ncbi:hypothetical protein Q095_00361 [Pseudomonas aeruginosa PS50]|uniref:hypothetical protein n=1 Tax=Pseudomonas aeruginosa TaxID=287 RepID=UPI00044E8F32|nr:hypothetical protein [Pseudomonas aeruginosa]ETU79908.1 hypothetical protein Q095_00361 [Pseudomonas aeruginosa PS50]
MEKEQTTTRISGSKPQDFLRARRPEQFSDSVKLQESTIDRSMLEYHFGTLNNRSQELQFEIFVRKLCEREICPNLVPQTGPTAGGDGKTDTETYPVSSQIAFFWGVNEAPEAERWAFGVSTQKDWRKKCRADVESIMSTERGYVRAFCISSQFIKNSLRAELQDELTEQYGVKVTIFDRTWLLDKTLQPKNQHLAIDYLGLTGSIESKIQIGPFDADKQIQLTEIERQIEQIEDPGRLTLSQVDLYTKRAVIYKELERDAAAVEHYFNIAVRAAKRFGTQRQHFDALYQLTWAAYWWLESAELFEETFEKAIGAAKETDNVEVWEKVVTLFNLVVTTHREGKCTLDVALLEATIREKLNSIAGDADMISGGLQAETSLALLDLLFAKNEEQVNSTFRSLSEIADSANKLIGYPMARLVNLLEELDVAFGDLESYEELMDKLIDDAGERENSRIKADKYLRRGALSSDKKDYYRAIKCFGQSLYGLYSSESKTEMFAALYMLSHAYERQGLLWAARGAALMAAYLATSDALKEQRGNAKQAAVFQQLMWIEGQLGRLGQSLTWYHLAQIISQTLDDDLWTESQKMSYEALVGKLFLNAGFSDIERLAWLPEKLNQLGLWLSADALLICLGHEDKAGPEGGPIDLEFINMWRSIDMGAPVAPLDLYLNRWTTISSYILGCKVSVSFPVKSPCMEIAQQLLAVLESFCAPMMAEHLGSTLPAVNIDISLEDEDGFILQHSFDTAAQVTSAEILCSSFSIANLTDQERDAIRIFYNEFCLRFVTIICPQIGWSRLEKMLQDDKALERAVLFNCNIGLDGYFIGRDAAPGIATHQDASLELHKPTRRVAWFDHYNIQPIDWRPRAESSEGRPAHPFQFSTIKHRELKISSLIQISLWDQAGWRGVGFQAGGGEIPAIVFLFENPEVGGKIFSNIAKNVGDKDPDNKLRIVLMRGISKKNTAHYRVVVGSNFEPDDDESSSIYSALSRFLTVTPNSSQNLDRFLSDYERYKKCHVVTMDAKGRPTHHLSTSGIVVINAWEIDDNHQDIAALQPDDDVLIPEGVNNPPISRALARIRSSESRKA